MAYRFNGYDGVSIGRGSSLNRYGGAYFHTQSGLAGVSTTQSGSKDQMLNHSVGNSNSVLKKSTDAKHDGDVSNMVSIFSLFQVSFRHYSSMAATQVSLFLLTTLYFTGSLNNSLNFINLLNFNFNYYNRTQIQFFTCYYSLLRCRSMMLTKLS